MFYFNLYAEFILYTRTRGVNHTEISGPARKFFVRPARPGINILQNLYKFCGEGGQKMLAPFGPPPPLKVWLRPCLCIRHVFLKHKSLQMKFVCTCTVLRRNDFERVTSFLPFFTNDTSYLPGAASGRTGCLKEAVS